MLIPLSVVYGFLQRRELVPPATNRTSNVDRAQRGGRRRALTREELGRFGEAMRAAEGDAHPSALLALRFLALTGFRLGEAVGRRLLALRGEREGLRWADVDLETGRVFLADTKAGAQVRVIGAAAADLLRGARPDGAGDEDCVFPGNVSPDRPIVGFNNLRQRLYKKAGIGETAEGKADTHSLRHTFATVGAHLHHGRYAGLIGPLLGHSHGQQSSVTARYVHSSPEALRPAADAVAGELARLLGLGAPAEVVDFPARAEGPAARPS